MGNVLSFDAGKRARENKSKEKSVATKPLTTREIFENCYSDVIDDWQLAAVKNGLNDYIRQKIPSKARGADNADYVGDLNAVSAVEQKLEMLVTIFYPEVTPSNPHSWLVGFHLGKEVYSAPPHMVSEAYARALNILLYIEFTAQLKKLKRL
jgi:hypothetical protein